jgi:hypothetical protein
MRACRVSVERVRRELAVALHVDQQPAVQLRGRVARLLERAAVEQRHWRCKQTRQAAISGVPLRHLVRVVLLLLLLGRLRLRGRAEVASLRPKRVEQRRLFGSMRPASRESARGAGAPAAPSQRWVGLEAGPRPARAVRLVGRHAERRGSVRLLGAARRLSRRRPTRRLHRRRTRRGMRTGHGQRRAARVAAGASVLPAGSPEASLAYRWRRAAPFATGCEEKLHRGGQVPGASLKDGGSIARLGSSDASEHCDELVSVCWCGHTAKRRQEHVTESDRFDRGARRALYRTPTHGARPSARARGWLVLPVRKGV